MIHQELQQKKINQKSQKKVIFLKINIFKDYNFRYDQFGLIKYKLFNIKSYLYYEKLNLKYEVKHF